MIKSAQNSVGTTVVTRWDSGWNKQLSHLIKFHESNGRWPKASEDFPKKNRLGQWANRQRDIHHRGELDSQRVNALNKAGFSWQRSDARAMHWEDQYRHLVEFRKKFPAKWPFARQDFPKANRLGLWVWRQRQCSATRQLSKKRKGLLEKIGFPFELPDQWEGHYQMLRHYRVKNPGRWPKAREEFPKGNKLGLWAHLQRCAHKMGKLWPERVSKMDKIGFQWSVKEVGWNRFFDLLKAYKKQNPKKWPMLESAVLQDRRLIAWCTIQRNKRDKGQLDKTQIARLDALGFRW